MFWGGGLFQVFGTYTTPVGRGLDDGSPENMEGETSFGAVRGVAEEGGSGPDHLSKFLPRGGPGGATIWFGNLGVDSSDATKIWGGTHVFHASVERD